MLSVAGKVIQDTSYLVVGAYNSPLNHSSLYVRKLNAKGETVFLQSIYYGIHSINSFFGNSFIHTHDDNYLFVGQRGNTDTLDNFLAIKIDVQGNVIWEYNYGLPNTFDSNTQAVATLDGGYLLIGWTASLNASTGLLNYSQFYLVKIDSIGNKLWEKKIGSNAEPLHAEQTQDGGFILSGYKYSSATGYDMYVVKTDSLGNLQWQQTYGTEHNDNGGFVRELSNGHYILFGTISLDTELQDYYYIAELDENGTELWHELHEFNQYCGNNTVPYLETANNSAIAIMYHYTATSMRVIEFCRFSTIDGSIITRTPISSGLPGEDYIRDIEPTPDGGYLLVGFNYTSPAKSWVLKVDSLGHTCGPAPCDSVAYPLQITPPLIEGGQGGEQTMQAQIYPNPAKGSTTITCTLPPQLPFGVAELYNLQGEKVRYWVLQPSINPFRKEGITQNLDLEGIAPGMYVWRLALPGGYEQYEASGKMVVE
ncbi:hypothetical protein C7N43_32760 [Sphingobacteriales bacterium UPWRP_1]|nr:hypothetical protein C7N43_32760 [Sphingobacteriales bacterium UPWRP_1]